MHLLKPQKSPDLTVCVLNSSEMDPKVPILCFQVLEHGSLQ